MSEDEKVVEGESKKVLSETLDELGIFGDKEEEKPILSDTPSEPPVFKEATPTTDAPLAKEKLRPQIPLKENGGFGNTTRNKERPKISRDIPVALTPKENIKDSQKKQQPKKISENTKAVSEALDASTQIFADKMKEKAASFDEHQESISTEEYAGFWRRLGAYSVDVTILFYVFMIIAVIAYKAGLLGSGMAAVKKMDYISYAFMPIYALYFAVMESSGRQGTFGKRISGIKVIGSSGGRISFKRALGRWFAAILNYVTLTIGYILVGVTKKKRGLHDMIADTYVVAYRKSKFWSRSILLFVIQMALFGAIYLIFLSEFISGMLGGGMEMMSGMSSGAGNISTYTTPISHEKSTTKPVYTGSVLSPKREWSVTSKEEYEKILENSSVEIDGKRTQKFGAIAIKQDTFWKDETYPKVWITAKASDDVPNLNFSQAQIEIEYVLSPKGYNIHDKSSTFEFERNDGISWKQQSTIKTVHLLSGAKEPHIAGIRGKFMTNLPVNLQVAEFSAQDKGVQRILENGAKVTLEDVNGKKIKIKYEGSKDLYVSTIAYNAEGNKISWSGKSKSSYSNATTLNINYRDEEPQTIEVLVASEFLLKEYPFVLGKKYKK